MSDLYEELRATQVETSAKYLSVSTFAPPHAVFLAQTETDLSLDLEGYCFFFRSLQHVYFSFLPQK